MIVDRFNRVHDYLRISLTDNCNLRCFYCMPEEDYLFTPASQLMQPEEIFQLAKLFVENGVKKIRLTGGEPLVRKDAADIIQKLSTLKVSLSITTNATRLHLFIDLLQQSGIRSLNISLDTLQADKFLFLTRRDQFRQVRDNIELALSKNFKVKVNAVIMKGVNDDELNDFVAWTKDEPVHVRFIEFMPFSGNRWTSNKVFTLSEMLSVIQQRYTVETLPNDAHDTARSFQVPGHRGSFAVISTMSEPFCSGCNRIRLTADGKMKNCLFSKQETDLLTPLRAGKNVLPFIHESIDQKAWQLGGQLEQDFKQVHPENIDNRSMITIGG